MIWVVVFALIVSAVLNVLLSVLLSRRSAESMLMLDRSHQRTTKHTEALVDRLMAQDWAAFQMYQTQFEPVVEEPTVEADPVPVRGPDKGGFGSRLGLTAYRPPEEVEEEIETLNKDLP